MDPYTRRSTTEVPSRAHLDLGMDSDIAHSMKHMNDAEGKLGKWTLPEPGFVQLNSDPIVDTANSFMPHLPADLKEPGYPVDYFVPNFGLDEDIVNTQITRPLLAILWATLG